MSRVARIIAPGYPHHITQRGTNKTDIFLADDDRTFFLSTLRLWLERTDTNIWAYCLMNNHFHLLLEPTENTGIGKCLHGATFRYAQYFNSKYCRTGRLWENRYFSCPVDKDAYLWAVVRYIERNPVRAGIAKRAEHWKWSSAHAHVTGTPDSAIRLLDWLESSEQSNYANFLDEAGNDDSVRKATSTGRPLGNANFFEILEEQLGRVLKPSKRGRPSKTKLGGCP